MERTNEEDWLCDAAGLVNNRRARTITTGMGLYSHKPQQEHLRARKKKKLTTFVPARSFTLDRQLRTSSSTEKIQNSGVRSPSRCASTPRCNSKAFTSKLCTANGQGASGKVFQGQACACVPKNYNNISTLSILLY